MRQLAALVIALTPGMVIAMMVSLVVPVLPAVAEHFGHDAQSRLLAQYFVAITGLGVLVGAPLAGSGVDRFGYRLVVVSALLIFMLGGLSGAVLSHPIAMLLSRFVVGVGAGGFSASALALLGERWEGVARSRLIGYVTAIGSGAAILLLLAGGYLGEIFSWRAPFLVYAAAAPLVLFALLLPSERRHATAKVRPISWGEWRLLAPVLISAVFLYCVLFTTTTQFPLLLADAGFDKAGERSLFMASQAVIGMVAAIFYAPVRQRLGRRGLTLLVLALFSSGMAAMAMSNGPAPALLTCLLCGLGMGLMPSHVGDELLETAPAEIRGRAGAALVSFRYLAQFLNPVIVGSLGAAIGLRPTLLTVSGALLVWFVATAPSALRARRAA